MPRALRTARLRGNDGKGSAAPEWLHENLKAPAQKAGVFVFKRKLKFLKPVEIFGQGVIEGALSEVNAASGLAAELTDQGLGDDLGA